MTLPAGTRLGPYEILAPIGAGGMGEVYRANDTRLDRTVAIKVLGEGVAGRAGSRERFEREARTVAGLSHPHICSLHDVGQHDGIDFLVMEHLEGETLARRLSRGALPLEAALHHAVEIAEALAEAHRHGVVHRDLKPGNVMLTRSGAKLLDFGLAKLRRDEGTQSPSEAKTLTAENVLVGTLPYMAPEQLEGRSVDARTDLFAFGAVVYEMVTGVRAFAGESQASLIASIVSGAVPSMALRQPVAPVPLDVLVGQCLRKDPDERWQSAHDAGLRLREIAEEDSDRERRHSREPKAWLMGVGAAVLSLLVGAAAGRFWLGSTGGEEVAPIVRSQIGLSTDPVLTLTPGTGRTEITFSPDGALVVFGGSPDGTVERSMLYRRALDGTDATPIPGTEGARQPFFSPDGQWIGFFDHARSRLRKIPVAGGLAVDLAEIDELGPMGAFWGGDGRIILGTQHRGLEWISDEGGSLRSLTTIDRTRETGHRLPWSLPGGRALLFTAASHAWGVEARVEALSLASGAREVLVENAADARFLPSGHLVFLRQGTLMAAPFDPDRLEVTAPPAPVLQGLRQALNLGDSRLNSGAGQYAVSPTGLLVYATGGIYEDPTAELVLVDRVGGVEPLPGFDRPLTTGQVRFSPDGRQITFTEKARSGLVWLFDVERRTHRPLSKEGIASWAVWSPDGRRLVLGWSAAGPLNLWSVAVGGTEAWERLTATEAFDFASSWSPDGRWLAFVRWKRDDDDDVFVYDFAERRAIPFLATNAEEDSPEISPDGRWMAYASDESGRFEVYVTTFPDREQTLVVSREGAASPAWTRDGGAILYVSNDRQLKEVVLTDGPTPTLGHPRTVLKLPPDLRIYGPLRGYDVHPDGRRFLFERRDEVRGRHPITRLQLVQNWFAELERLNPTR